MKLLLKGSSLIFFLLFSNLLLQAQTCTLTGTSPLDWTNPGPNCTEGGNAGGATVLVVPAGFTINFNGNTDTWTGTRIEIYGTLQITAPGQVTINSNLVVKSGGLLDVGSKLNLGTSTGCGYTLAIESGGSVNIVGSTPDRLNVCGVEIARGGTAGCNPYPAGPLPYCEPGGGFTGPTGFDEAGVNLTLPIKLAYFTAEVDGNQVAVKWATDKEENFDHFEIEHTSNGENFSAIGSVQGAGYNTSTFQAYSWLDVNPIIGENYYRLKAVDLNGSFEYFKVVSATVSGQEEFSVYPNPSDGSTIAYKINFDFDGGDRIILLNSLGNELQSSRVSNVEGEFQFAEQLKPGIYLLQYASDRFTKTIRVAIQ
jgi:hypothetical protein